MSSESVKVVVRCRPMNDKEKSCKMVVLVETSRCQCFIKKPGAKEEPPKQFTFDGAYFIAQTTEQMYNEIAYPLVEGATEGYNGTIFAYGQTGSGKSFTMQGVSEPAAQRGVIPRAFEHIFESIQCAENTKFLVRASYLEIYNEEIRDLLGNDAKQKMELKEHPERGVYVRDLSLHTVHSVAECERIMKQGWGNRSVGYTLMNKDSSRSHSIFTIHLEICNTDAAGEDHLRAGKLNLVDLAGSERQSKTGATGERLREATKINLSLSALGNVISALVDGRSKHIPYRDSKLTRLLQDSLGGNTRTLMVACLSPADSNYEESLSTLRYANRAKSIQNRPRINEDPKDALLREYQDEIKQLRALVSGQLTNGNAPFAHLPGPILGPSPCLSRPQSSTAEEKDKIKEEYEEKLARLQAEYNAEQESNAKLQEDIALLRSSYENRLSSLKKTRASRGHSNNTNAAPENSVIIKQAIEEELTDVEPALVQLNQMKACGQMTSVPTRSEGGDYTDSPPVITSGSLDQQLVLERLQQLEQEVVGGEQARNKELLQRHQQRKTLADQRKKQLIEALAENCEESDNVMLNVYDSIQEEVRAKNRLLENTQAKLKVAKLEIRDLQVEFELERNDYLATIRRLETEGKLLQSLLERICPLVRRDCNYSNLDRLRREATWDEDSATWTLPEVVVQKTSLPSAVAPSAQILSARRSSAAATGEFSQDEEDRYKEMLNRSDSENFSSNYFKLKRANQLLGCEPLNVLAGHSAPHSAPKGNGMPPMNSSSSNNGPPIAPPVSAESLLPRPFRLESLGMNPSNGKVKRKKSRTHLLYDGN
ncbi:hypothetical protein DPEC_G00207060 [Dallia pectoralis]|uniref:Uncharacterized protein n=1 Tax=Dallia pectoralis TaxID=75939 RepID=A0ACC2G4G9_DALPE|nr:hypothetical protein DPEC_G00207060 [Dallia pectoralis]